ncbi:hypothetical protein Dimus_013717, partial [Dionaea muscipula]
MSTVVSTATVTAADIQLPSLATLLSSIPSAERAITQTLTSSAHLANLLPTGTLMAFQLLTPTFTNNGACDAVLRPLTVCLLLFLALSCFLACFTDSLKAPNGQVYYGFATLKGMWLLNVNTGADSGSTAVVLPDLSSYRIQFIDFVHAFLSLLVFGVVAIRDKNVMSCVYPTLTGQVLED